MTLGIGTAEFMHPCLFDANKLIYGNEVDYYSFIEILKDSFFEIYDQWFSFQTDSKVGYQKSKVKENIQSFYHVYSNFKSEWIINDPVIKQLISIIEKNYQDLLANAKMLHYWCPIISLESSTHSERFIK
eukprot:gene9677-11863_t